MPAAKRKKPKFPKWRKSPEKLVAVFDQLIKAVPQGERRKMFGYPCCFVQGQLFTGLHQENLIMRLGDTDREKFQGKYKTGLFSPFPGRVMREYVVVPPRLLKGDLKEAKTWVKKSLAYAASLPPKEPGKKKGAKKKTTVR